MNVLFLGDIYGRTGRKMIQKFLPELRTSYSADWVIANGENATGGRGISLKHGKALLECGIDVITGGNHIFARSDWPQILTSFPRILRPHNIGGDAFPGSGLAILPSLEKPVIAVMNLAGRVFMEPAECPFYWTERLLERIPPNIPVILDFHAEATSEKIALSWAFDGKLTLVAGTHTHVQTADERILPQGTAAITDVGMTGPKLGVLGVDRNIVIQRFRCGYSSHFEGAKGPGVLEGIFVSISTDKKVLGIKRVRIDESTGSLNAR